MIKSTHFTASSMNSLGICIQFHVILLDKVLQNFIVRSDHLPSIEKIEIWNGMINLQYVILQFSGCHDRYILELMNRSTEGNDGKFLGLTLHFYKRI
jgi:hypothetical protein